MDESLFLVEKWAHKDRELTNTEITYLMKLIFTLVDRYSVTKTLRRKTLIGRNRARSRGSGTGPLAALLDALRTDLDVDLEVRKYSEHSLEEGTEVKAGSFVELVTPGAERGVGGFWGVGADADIAGSGLRAVLSAANAYIGDLLPQASSPANPVTQPDSVLAPSKQRDHTPLADIAAAFKTRYHFDDGDNQQARCTLVTYNLTNISPTGDTGRDARRRSDGGITIDSKVTALTSEGNGPLSSLIGALEGVTGNQYEIKEYTQHSIGAGSGVRAASFVELSLDGGQKTVWGAGADEDITSSGLRAVLSPASAFESGK
ncbi:hypothetical protein FRC05_007034 [Tulasnella sp. 425]|nr:hypothetical protein FRC05_007034 [Tulasnella sp. 425]